MTTLTVFTRFQKALGVTDRQGDPMIGPHVHMGPIKIYGIHFAAKPEHDEHEEEIAFGRLITLLAILCAVNPR